MITGIPVAVLHEPLYFSCNVMVQVALVAFTLKLAFADTLPLVLLDLEAPTVADVVDCGAIAPPSAVTAAAPSHNEC